MTEIEIRKAWQALVEIGRVRHPVLYGRGDTTSGGCISEAERQRRRASRLARRRELRRQQAEARAM